MSGFYDAAFYWSVGSFVKFEVHNEGIVKASVGSMLSAMSAGLMSVGMSSGADSFGLSSMSSFSAMISILLTGWPSLVVNLFTVRWPFMYIFLPFFRCVNEAPRRKQRGIYQPPLPPICAASGGELDPKRLNVVVIIPAGVVIISGSCVRLLMSIIRFSLVIGV